MFVDEDGNDGTAVVGCSVDGGENSRATGGGDVRVLLRSDGIAEDDGVPSWMVPPGVTSNESASTIGRERSPEASMFRVGDVSTSGLLTMSNIDVGIAAS